MVDSTHTHEPAKTPPSPASVSHHLELSYVFEVDAVEMPGLESQVVPEDEPAISISAGAAEVLDDDVLPYEARKEKSGVRSPKSEVQSTQSEVRGPKSEAPPVSAQPRLPGVE